MRQLLVEEGAQAIQLRFVTEFLSVNFLV